MTQAEKPLVNRVASSGLISLNLEKYYPQGDIAAFDLKNYLFMEMILKEKDFREAIAAHDWTQYVGKHLAVYCSADAIIPMWAYMLVAVEAAPFASDVIHCSVADYPLHYFTKKIAEIDASQYEDKRLIIKGCSDKPVPPGAYLEISRKLQPVARSIMFGEPCSTVPVYKKKLK